MNETDALCDSISYSLRLLLRDYRKCCKTPQCWQTVVRSFKGQEDCLQNVGAILGKIVLSVKEPDDDQEQAPPPRQPLKIAEPAHADIQPPPTQPKEQCDIVPFVPLEHDMDWEALQTGAGPPAEIYQVHLGNCPNPGPSNSYIKIY